MQIFTYLHFTSVHNHNIIPLLETTQNMLNWGRLSKPLVHTKEIYINMRRPIQPTTIMSSTSVNLIYVLENIQPTIFLSFRHQQFEISPFWVLITLSLSGWHLYQIFSYVPTSLLLSIPETKNDVIAMMTLTPDQIKYMYKLLLTKYIVF